MSKTSCLVSVSDVFAVEMKLKMCTELSVSVVEVQIDPSVFLVVGL